MTPPRGICETCGAVATSSEGFVCETCDSLREQMAYEVVQRADCMSCCTHHLEIGMKASGLVRREHVALSDSYSARANVHGYRWRQLKDKLDAREIAYTERLAAAAAAKEVA